MTATACLTRPNPFRHADASERLNAFRMHSRLTNPMVKILGVDSQAVHSMQLGVDSTTVFDSAPISSIRLIHP